MGCCAADWVDGGTEASPVDCRQSAAELATWDAEALGDQGIDLKPWFTDEELEAFSGGEDGELVEVQVQPPPIMAWVLFGIPTVRFGEIAEAIERLAQTPDIICEMTQNNG